MSLTQKTIDIPIKNIKMSAGQLLKQANQFKRLGKLDSAIAEYKKSVDLNPHFAWSHYQLAQVLEKTGNLEEACIEYQKAIEINPYATSIYYRLGVALEKAGQPNEAISILKKVIEIQPSFYLAYKTLADNYKKLGYVEESLIVVKKLNHLNPNFLKTHPRHHHLLNQNSSNQLPYTISLEEITRIIWDFGRIDGSYIGQIQLLPNGKIEGINSSNEFYWSLEENGLVFYDDNRQPTTEFNSLSKENDQWLLVGQFLLTRDVIHTLKEVGLEDYQKYIDNLRQAPIEKLRDETWLEEYFLPSLGLNNEFLHEFPSHLYSHCGFGLKSWQYPNQFSKYLVWLSEQNINSYLEIGCRHGGTFIITLEYLQRFSKKPIQGLGIDPVPSHVMKHYVRLNPNVTYLNISSQHPNFNDIIARENFDLVLIDGDHRYEGVLYDFNLVKRSSRLVALHDIASDVCPGVVYLWNQIKHNYARSIEFIEQYDSVPRNYLGIGVIESNYK
jgi:tetratricopeptide (TPR) repeat protein